MNNKAVLNIFTDKNEAPTQSNLGSHASQSMPNLNLTSNIPNGNRMSPMVLGSGNKMTSTSGNFSSSRSQVATHTGYVNNIPVSAPGYVSYGNPYEVYANYPPGYVHYQSPHNGAPSGHSIVNNTHTGAYPSVQHGHHMYIHSMPSNLNTASVIATEGDIIRATSGNMGGRHQNQNHALHTSNVANKQVMVHQVKFKRLTKSYLLTSQQQNIKVGSYVIVQADRGEDLGMVLARSPLDR